MSASDAEYRSSKPNEANKPFRTLARAITDRHGVEVTHVEVYSFLASYKRRPRAYAVRLLAIEDEDNGTQWIANMLADKYKQDTELRDNYGSL